MDAVGSERATILGFLHGGAPAMFFAATRPDRAAGLILNHTAARFVRADDSPIGLPPEAVSGVLEQRVDAWGTEDAAYGFFSRRASDPAFRRWFARHSRSAASPRAAGAYLRDMLLSDARSILPAIHVPTAVIHRTDYPFVPIEHARYLAEHIEGARLVELPGVDAVPIWEDPEGYLGAVREFVNPDACTEARVGRVLATVLFTDIVGSTERAAALGDREWKALLDLHDEISRRVVQAYDGRLVETTGDEIRATFDGPGGAILCASELGNELDRIGLPIRSGLLHAGEVERRGNRIGGMAVHLAARIRAAAGSGEVLVSRTVRNLVVGSDIAFDDHGVHELKGVDGEWHLYALAAD